MKKIIICFFLILNLAPLAYGANPDPLLAKMQKNYAELNSFKADFAQELYHRESQNTQKRSGQLSFEKPFLLYWDTQKPLAELLAVTPTEIWAYFPEEELAYKYNLALLEDSQTMLAFVTGQSSIDKDFEVENMPDVQENGKTLKHYMLYPFKPTVEFTQGELWLDSATGLIDSIKIVDFYGNTNKVTLQNMALNPKLSSEIFKFAPPEGTEIEDHTGQTDFSINQLTQ